MDELRITLRGQSHTISRERVIDAMRDRAPETIQSYATDIEGRTFPVKQVLAETLGVPRSAFISTRAQAILTRLGFRVWDVTKADAGSAASDRERDERRARALSLAVRFAGTAAFPDVEGLLRVADDLDRWLAKGTVS